MEPDDPTWGDSTALVTIVAFSDFECPFCARVQPTLRELQEAYGPSRLRLVHKHNPLAFHRNARPAALATQAVFVAAGAERFFQYAAAVYEAQRELSDETLARLAEAVGVPREAFDDLRAGAAVARSVDDDVALAGRLGVNGTPVFLVNGAELVGARPLEDFRRAIDGELAAARALVEQGTPPARVYAERVAANREGAVRPALPEPELAEPSPPEQATVHRVPVGRSPVLGPAEAPVTIVAFSDFECPFCRRASETLAGIRAAFGADVRVVFKHHPLSFHPNAVPAARLAILAHALKGDAGFWAAHDRLFDAAALDRATLDSIGRSVGLPAWRVRRALDAEATPAQLDDDLDLAATIPVKGTPTFFVNGRRIAGAVPFEEFEAVVRSELERARALEKERGLRPAEIYAATLEAAPAPPEPERRVVAAPPPKSPARGPATAPVVVQVFSDFQCPFCARAVPTLERLEKEFRGKVRIVWRHLPLSFHARARPAATAALEAMAQGGPAKFWKMHDLLFEHQAGEGGLEDAALVRHAASLGLDVKRFQAALADGRHDAVIDADLAAAKDGGIRGTPAFSVNEYFVSGARPYAELRRLVRRALADAGHP